MIRRVWCLVFFVISVSLCLTGYCSGADASGTASLDSPKLELVGICFGREYIDGPALEAATAGHTQMAVDAKGNMFFTAAYEGHSGHPITVLRCLGTDGMVRTLAGDDWFLPYTDAEEGPGGMLPTRLGGGFRGHRTSGIYITVKGLPFEGEDQGSLYVPLRGYPCRIYRNKKKDNRWWFKVLGKGDIALPAVVGESVPFVDANLKGVGLEEKIIKRKGYLYEWDREDGEITCLLTPADYGDKALHWKTGKAMGAAEQITISDNGTFYVQYYGKSYPFGQVFQISKDRSRVEEIVRCVKDGKDGPGLKTGYHCGPVNIEPAYKDILLLTSQDSNYVRRWKNGRVSTLWKNGEWRETSHKGRSAVQVMAKRWKYVPGHSYIYIRYPGEEMSKSGIWKFGPVDFLKSTVGPKLGGE